MSQTPDIVERLRATSPRYDKLNGKHLFDVFNNRDGQEAADTIEALRSEVTDLQNTIIRLTRELGEARDAEAADIVAWLRNDTWAARGLREALADAIARHEHRKELSHD